ncbi:MAG: acetylornithine deacetylase [Parvibaculaceae bacterium]
MDRLEATLAILDRLVGFPTVSARSNLDLVDYVDELLAGHGIAARRIPDASGKKASLLATIGPADEAGIVLSAHTDVVPAEEPSWSSPPFTATTRGKRVHGRGACDMKSFIAVCLAAVDMFKRAATRTPVHLAFSYDEEVGCRGAPDLVKATAALPARPALCIVGEPTSLRVVSAHKGKIARRIRIIGRTGHSAMPHRAANAVFAAARIVARLEDMAQELARLRYDRIAFDPPYSTLHVGSLHGGTALNLVPDQAAIEFEVRSVPDADTAGLLARIDELIDEQRRSLRRSAPEADIVVEALSAYPGLAPSSDQAAVTAVAELAQAAAGTETVSFGTEAGLYSEAGIATVVCGPGDMARAHKADEWIGLDELEGAHRMMERLAHKLGRPIAEWPART